jgi:hypothetical protein
MADPSPPPQSPEQEVAGLSVQELLEILGLHAPVQRGTIQGRVQRRLDALPLDRTHDREVLKAIGRRLLDYMAAHHVNNILLNEDLEDYTAIQDSTGQISQNPTRFYGAPAYPQHIVAGDLNPIRRRVMTRTLMVDSTFRKQYVAGDGILACSQQGCTSNIDACCGETEPAEGVASCYQAPFVTNHCQSLTTERDEAPSTDWDLWRGQPAGKYTEAFRNQFLNCLPNAGEGVVLPCHLYADPAADFAFYLQRSTTKVLSMTLTSVQLPAAAVLTVPHPDPGQYLAGPGLHNLQCVYPTPDSMSFISRLDPRSTIWIVDETDRGSGPGYEVYPLPIPAGHYADTFAMAQAITTAWQRMCLTATTTPLSTMAGAFRADGVRAAYATDPANQEPPHAISLAHTTGHIALSVPTEYPEAPDGPWRLSIWFVPPPMTPDGYLNIQARGTTEDDCAAYQSNYACDPVCDPPAAPASPITAAVGQSFKCVGPSGGDPPIPAVLRGRRPQVYKAMPGSLGWALGYRVAQIAAADFAGAPQPLPEFYGPAGVYPVPPSNPPDGVVRSVLIGSAKFQSTPPYLFLRVNDHNNNYYAAVEGIAGESVMPPDTLAILHLTPNPTLAVVPNGGATENPGLAEANTGWYSPASQIPYKREYFGPVDVARVQATLLDNNRAVCDLGQNNFSFTLMFETLYNL